MSTILSQNSIRDQIVVTGHRGNTRYWFLKYCKNGADLIEVDVEERHGEFILTHRSRNNPYLLRDKILHYLSSIHIRKPLKLEDALILAKKHGVGLLIDLKKPGIGVKVLNYIHEIDPGFKHLIITSRWHTDLAKIKAQEDSIITLLSIDEHPIEITYLIRKAKAAGITIRTEYFTDEILSELKSKGFFIAVWPVNNYEEALRLIRKGVNMIITDNVKVIKLVNTIKNQFYSLFPR